MSFATQITELRNIAIKIFLQVTSAGSSGRLNKIGQLWYTHEKQQTSMSNSQDFINVRYGLHIVKIEEIDQR